MAAERSAAGLGASEAITTETITKPAAAMRGKIDVTGFMA
jgi:hypothetical protein